MGFALRALSSAMVIEMNERKATPRQIAFLEYMKVENADPLSFDQASSMINTIDERRPKKNLGEEMGLSGEWHEDRLILFPVLYENERMETLIEQARNYVRNCVVGASEKLTKGKIKDVIETLDSVDTEWWKNEKWNQRFFEELKGKYPGCCDGEAPGRKEHDSRSGSGCLSVVVLFIVLIIIFTIKYT